MMRTRSPYDEALVQFWHTIPTAYFDRTIKAWKFSPSAYAQVCLHS
jgi:hypothetical protein